MLVEIHGAGFQNKGAELMLATTVHELRSRVPDLDVAIDPTYGPFTERARLGLLQTMPPRSHVGTPGFARRFLTQRLFSTGRGTRVLSALGLSPGLYGGVPLGAIRGFVDIAGFAYSDQWGGRPTHDLAALAAYFRARNVPVILLPQAFGPFRHDDIRASMQRVLQHATLVYARDQQSLEYLGELGASKARVMLAPDITLFYSGEPSLHATGAEPYACVVPNMRVLDRGRKGWADRYLPDFVQIARRLAQRGLAVRVVVHDASGEDAALARRCVEDAALPAVRLVEERSPLALKRLLGGSMLVVGSRYHSLVAALSQQVPAVAVGWSHKYEMLFRDFGLQDFVFTSADESVDVLLERVTTLTDTAANAAYRREIGRRLDTFRIANTTMWDDVTTVLTGRA
jgi:colanic acid/amylovoran biosynthesis protein